MKVQPKWILIVDDEIEILESLKELLTLTFGEEELRILEARNGIEATSKVKNQRFDCIITDMKMPKKEGDALIVSVRQNPFNSDTPIIMLSGFPNKKILKQFRFVYLIEKPFLHSELTDLVATQLKVGSKGRLAADIVNNLVNATSKFLEKALNKENEASVESPVVKKAGETISVEYVSQVDIYDNGIQNSFSILVKEEDLLNMGNLLPSIKNTPIKHIGFALGQSILGYVLKSMKSNSGNYKINSFEKEEAQASVLSKKGIIIPIRCGDVLLRVLACGEKSKAA